MDPASKKTVLLVDDDEAVRNCLLSMLEASGHKFRECPGKTDLLLSDIRMPKMSGIELALKVQLERPETRILLISGYRLETSPWQCDWRFLENPITPQMLTEEIGAILRGMSMNQGA
jgi:two-component SAPR family response regulator